MPHTHDFIQTGQIDQNLVLPENGEALEIVTEAAKLDNINGRSALPYRVSDLTKPFEEAARGAGVYYQFKKAGYRNEELNLERICIKYTLRMIR